MKSPSKDSLRQLHTKYTACMYLGRDDINVQCQSDQGIDLFKTYCCGKEGGGVTHVLPVQGVWGSK